MGKGFKHGAGGVKREETLNFTVNAYPSEVELNIATPAENTIGVVTANPIKSWDLSATEPTKRSANKNMVVVDTSTTTKNGVTFTVNNDGSITVNGTASANAEMRFVSIPVTRLLEVGKTYTLKGTGNSNIAIGIHERTAQNSWVKTHAQEYGKDVTFRYNGVAADGNDVYVYLYVPSGKTVSSVTVYPQLEKGSTSTSFVKGDATGQVWISTGVSGFAEFNALKKNGIWVNPIFAKQYVSGSWVEKTAEIYHNGEWSELGTEAVYLLKHFEVNPDDFEFQNYEKGYGNWTITSEKINISGKLFSFQKKATVDLTRFNTVHFRINCNSTKAGCFHLCASKNSLMGNYLADLSAPAMVAPAATGEQELTLDVSNLTGLYYIGGKTSYRDNAGGTTTMDIFDIWMD